MTARQNKLLRLVTAPSEKAGLLAQGLVDLYKAVKGAGFYPQGHPYRTEPLQRAFEAFQRLVSERELVLAVNRQGFVPGVEGAEGGAMVLQLARECFIRRIASITLMEDLVLADLEIFAELLSADPYKTSSAGGFARQLEEAGVRTVWINEKDLSAIWAKRNAASGPEAEPAVEAGEDWDALPGQDPGLEAPKDAGARSVQELLRLMELEKSDVRYQSLGRELVDSIRGAEPGELAMLPILEELLRQHQDEHRTLPQREYALFALERLADGAADQLMDLLESLECPDMEGIHRVLAALGVKGAYWIIQRVCLAEGVCERKALAGALVRLGPAAAAPVISMMKDERWYVVRNMVSILGELRSPETVLALKKPLFHDDLRVRKEAIRALMKIGGEPAETTLISLLDEPDETVVRHAILSLGLMRSRLAVAPLLKLLERRDLLLKGLGLKRELALALGRIGDRRATAPLLKMLGVRGWPVLGRWLELKLTVALALGILGDESTLPALNALAAGHGPVSEACRDAVDAIERLSGAHHD